MQRTTARQANALQQGSQLKATRETRTPQSNTFSNVSKSSPLSRTTARSHVLGYTHTLITGSESVSFGYSQSQRESIEIDYNIKSEKEVKKSR